jgi:hypothetical protein
MEPWEVAAREAIRDLVARYAHAADSGRFDDLVALFTADGVLRLPGDRDARGHAAIREFLGGTNQSLRAKTTTMLIRHHLSNLRIDVTSATEATGAVYFLVITERGLDHWGRYRDVYAALDGRWLFAERRVRLEGWTPGSWAAERHGRPPGRG